MTLLRVVLGCAAIAATPRIALAHPATCTPVDGGGAVLVHPEISLTFWGSYWTTNPAPTPSVQAHVASVQKILNGPYLSLLNQYRNVGQGRMVPGINISTATQPPSTPSATDVANFLKTQMRAPSGGGLPPVPPPVANADMLYVVYAPPGSGFFHSYATFDNGVTFAFALVSDYGTPFAGATNMPGVPFSHELVEAVTDPWYTGVGQGGNCEIADACNFNLWPSSTSMENNGYAVTSYWSAADQKCVIPTEWQSVYKWSGSGTNWTLINSNPVRQIYGGVYGVLATDTNDAPNLYTASSNQWKTISSVKGAMYAVGNSGVTMLASDASSESYFNGTSWSSSFGGFATAVYGDSAIYGTDPSGGLWQLNPANDQWSPLGGPADEVATDGENVYLLAWDHQSVWTLPNSGGTWSAIGASASGIVAGGMGYGLLATTLDSNRYGVMWNGGTSWTVIAGPALEFAITSQVVDGSRAQDFFAIASNRNNGTWWDQALQSWVPIGGAAGRLVTAGANGLYGTLGINYLTY